MQLTLLNGLRGALGLDAEPPKTAPGPPPPAPAGRPTRISPATPARAAPLPTLGLDPRDASKLAPQPGRVQLAISSKLENGRRSATHAIVLHMTGGTVASTLQAYKTASVGAHFLIGKDGTIYQTARMDQIAFHVGHVRPKGLVPTAAGGNARVAADLDADSQAVFKLLDAKKISFGTAVRRLSALEAAKPYGRDLHDQSTRLPMNADSIGIEFEALVGKDGNYEALTDAQKASGAALVQLLEATYGLSPDDVYQHPDVSYKSYSEARGAKAAIEDLLP